MKIQRHTYGYRYFDEAIKFHFGDKKPELFETLKKFNAEWILIEYNATRSETDALWGWFFMNKRWAHKKDYERIYARTKI